MNGFPRLDARSRQRNRKDSKRRAPRRRLSTEPLEKRLLLTTYVVDSLADNIVVDSTTTLREAIEAANSDAPVGDAPAGSGADTIDFLSGLTGNINLSLGQLRIRDDLTINGPGATDITIDAGGASQVFYINENDFLGGGPIASVVNVEISGLTMTGGNAFHHGGGILSAENLTLRDSVVTGNTSSAMGGGVFAISYGVTTLIENTTISGNLAAQGGGIAALGHGTGKVTIRGTTVADNTAWAAGGALLYSQGTSDEAVAVENSTISGNESFNEGGGVAAINNLKTRRPKSPLWKATPRWQTKPKRANWSPSAGRSPTRTPATRTPPKSIGVTAARWK
jgi:hypothetical protein